jgi:hypothetical protein
MERLELIIIALFVLSIVLPFVTWPDVRTPRCGG